MSATDVIGYFDAFFRIMHESEIAPRDAHLSYKLNAQQEALTHLEGWFGFLEAEDDEDDS